MPFNQSMSWGFFFFFWRGKSKKRDLIIISRLFFFFLFLHRSFGSQGVSGLGFSGQVVHSSGVCERILPWRNNLSLIINDDIDNHGLSHLTVVDKCSVSTGLRSEGTRKGIKFWVERFNYKHCKGTQFQRDSVSLQRQLKKITAICIKECSVYIIFEDFYDFSSYL